MKKLLITGQYHTFQLILEMLAEAMMQMLSVSTVSQEKVVLLTFWRKIMASTFHQKCERLLGMQQKMLPMYSTRNFSRKKSSNCSNRNSKMLQFHTKCRKFTTEKTMVFQQKYILSAMENIWLLTHREMVLSMR